MMNLVVVRHIIVLSLSLCSKCVINTTRFQNHQVTKSRKLMAPKHQNNKIAQPLKVDLRGQPKWKREKPDKEAWPIYKKKEIRKESISRHLKDINKEAFLKTSVCVDESRGLYMRAICERVRWGGGIAYPLLVKKYLLVPSTTGGQEERTVFCENDSCRVYRGSSMEKKHAMLTVGIVRMRNAIRLILIFWF